MAAMQMNGSHSTESDGTRLVGNNNKMQTHDIKTPKDLVLWWMADKSGRWPILLFLGVLILSLLLALIALFDYSSVYVTAGVACLIVAAFGASHFKTLMALREQVKEFDALNDKFRTENAAMVKQLSKLKAATTALAGQEERLKEINQQSKQNLIKFESISKNLGVMGESSVAGMGGVLKTLNALDARLHRNLSLGERSLYLKVFDNMEMRDKEYGMTETEYNEFLDCLPASHRQKLEDHGSFETLAGADNTIDISEFKQVLDAFAGATAAGQRMLDNAL